MKNQIFFYIGTTAELIKLAAVLRRFNKSKIDFKIITSGQNEINFEELKPIIGKQDAAIAFPVKSKESSAVKFAFWTVKTLFVSIKRLRKEFIKLDKRKSYVIVHGDTISALIGALVAKAYGVKVAHVEAGYRSFNFFEPFPEEATRVLISFLADVHFCPDNWSLNNIKNHRGIKINTKENTLYETCMKALNLKFDLGENNFIKRGKYFVLVLHRQEHMMYKKALTLKYIESMIAFAKPELKCIFVLHKLTENFLIEQNLLEKIKNNPAIITVPRLPYLIFLKILAASQFIATDGGSNQAEAYFLGKPCLLLRKYTEQVEGLESNVVLAGDNLNVVRNFLRNYKKYLSKNIELKQTPSEIVTRFFLGNKAFK